MVVPARLTASGGRCAIASPHALATQAGLDAFAAGGNAIDAALAANAVLTVVYPHMCALGGDLFALLAGPDGRVQAINGSGAAPVGLDASAVRRLGPSMPLVGPLTITVPGTLAAWETLVSLGARFDLARLLEPAVRHARDGMRVAPSLGRALRLHGRELASSPGIGELFFRGRRPLAEGAVVRQMALGLTLESIAQQGAQAFYGGPVGERLVRGLQALGSPMTLDDLAAHATEITAPLQRTYRGWEVLTTPPNSQGFVLLEMLGALERVVEAIDPLGPHAPLMAEVFRLASLDRDRHLADPRHAAVPLGRLLGADHLGELGERARARMRNGGAVPGVLALPRSDTVAVVAADDGGHAISLIQSIFHTFGSRILESSTGILCQNRGASFSLDPAAPNHVAGGKRPAHTLMPVLVRRGGHVAFVSGTMGGTAQPQIQAELLGRVLDLGMSPGDAVAAPRWVVGGLELGTRRDVVHLERRAATLAPRITAVRMRVNRLGDLDEEVGHAQLIGIGGDGLFSAASDPRADGSAAAL